MSMFRYIKPMFAVCIALSCLSCGEPDSGTITITNSLSDTVRIRFAQDGESEFVSMVAGQTIERDYESYHELLFPDELPRAVYRLSHSRYTIIPMEQKTKTLYVTNKLGSSVLLYNSDEIDSADYAIPTAAIAEPVAFAYYTRYSFAVRNLGEDECEVLVKTEKVTVGESTETRTYLVIQPRGFS